MTDRSSEADAPQPDEVRRSLRALAEGSTRDCDPKSGAVDSDTQPASVVADAERATDCVRKATSFLSAGRLPELGRAVATAVRHGDDDVASRGRTARESLRRLDAALQGRSGTEPPNYVWSNRSDSDRGSVSGTAEPNRRVGADGGHPADPRERADHFRSGRGTVLGDTAQDSGR